jgi:hypothetical protein
MNEYSFWIILICIAGVFWLIALFLLPIYVREIRNFHERELKISRNQLDVLIRIQKDLNAFLNEQDDSSLKAA